jgi:hypothetical protein
MPDQLLDAWHALAESPTDAAFFRFASLAAEATVDILGLAEHLAEQGEQARARDVLGSVLLFAKGRLSDELRRRRKTLTRAAGGSTSAHDEVVKLWADLRRWCGKALPRTVPTDLLARLGVDAAGLCERLRHERGLVLWDLERAGNSRKGPQRRADDTARRNALIGRAIGDGVGRGSRTVAERWQALHSHVKAVEWELLRKNKHEPDKLIDWQSMKKEYERSLKRPG